jgi:anthranilate synthase/aminodeoxychorismate synthase-like glutamine amidotransferase
MILVIDNYDSFTYNLVQYLQELGASTEVYRNDKVSIGKLKRLPIERIVISPGPGRPKDSGISCDVIKEFYKKVPILGVCLGHQCIGEVFGGKIVKAPRIMHGKTSLIYHNRQAIFKKVKSPFVATRYHSLIIEHKTLPSNLSVTAYTKEGVIMGVKERSFPLFGVQFHPESILTTEGKKILDNFLNI